jgi:hypothetical protein
VVQLLRVYLGCKPKTMPRGHPKHKAQLAFPVSVARQCEHIAESKLSARRGHQRTSLRLQGVWFDCSQQLQATVWFMRFGNQAVPGSRRIHQTVQPQLATSCCHSRIVPAWPAHVHAGDVTDHATATHGGTTQQAHIRRSCSRQKSADVLSLRMDGLH